MIPKISEIVYLKTGEDTGARIITGVLRRKGSVIYELRAGINEATWHSDFEFSKEKPRGKQIRGLQP